MRIAVIVPTRGRPRNAQRLAKAISETAANREDTDVIFGVDEDDPEKTNYYVWLHASASIIAGPRLRMAGTLNAIARKIADDYDILGFMGDDHLPITHGWDDRIRAAMRPGGVVYCNDLIQGEALPTEVFLDARIVREIGGFVPNGFTHLFLDNTWKTWGQRAGTLTYLNDVIIEHVHPLAGKVESDAQYAEVNSHAVWTADEKRYNEYVASGELDRDVQKIKDIK